MKKFWKALALVGCALLLVVASVAGTYAILKSETATVSNTFTAGNVSISLKETKVDEYGEPVSPDETIVAGLKDTTTDGNEYKLIPNHTYKKDPTIVVAAGSEECYLFVKVENGISGIEAAGDTTIAKQLEANGWKNLAGNVWYYDADKNDGVDVDTPVDARTEAKDVPVFTTFTIANVSDFSDYVGEDRTKDPTIYITAYAAQADGFDNAQDAWANASFN